MADEKMEEETYSVIFSSLKHPIRRKILRMLNDESLAFSEILSSLSIDSGHLSYHLESLGDLITRTNDEKYQLSTIGIAALRLMKGVEEHEIRQPSHSLRLGRAVETVFRTMIVAALVLASLYSLTFTTQQYSFGIRADPGAQDSPVTIAPGQTIEFTIIVQYESVQAIKYRLFEDGAIKPIEPESHYLCAIASGRYYYTFQRSPLTSTFNLWEKGYLIFEIRTNDNTTADTTASLSTSIVELNPLKVNIHRPDGTVTSTFGVTDFAVSMQRGTVGLTAISAQGTYKCEVRNDGPKELDVTITPCAAWRLSEKPYFYYGTVGLIVLAAYSIIIILTKSAKSQLSRKLRTLGLS
jgi:DNA-binding transcriptional ArsR family regulator